MGHGAVTMLLRRVALVLAAAAVGLGSVLVARADVPAIALGTGASAPETPELVVTSDWSATTRTALAPGRPAYWLVDAWVVGVPEAELTLELRKGGELVEHPSGITLTLEQCASPWAGVPDAPRCDDAWAPVTTAAPGDDLRTSSPVHPLRTVGPHEPTHLLVTLALEDTPRSRADSTLMGLTGTVDLGITAVADDLTDGEPTASPSPTVTPSPSPGEPTPSPDPASSPDPVPGTEVPVSLTAGPQRIATTGGDAGLLLWGLGLAALGTAVLCTVAPRHRRRSEDAS